MNKYFNEWSKFKKTVNDVIYFKTSYILKLSKFKSAEIIRNWFLNAEVKTYLCVHEWGGIIWFNKERAETLIFVEVFFAFTKEDGDICSVKNAEALFSSLHQFISASEYKTEKLLRQISSVL